VLDFAQLLFVQLGTAQCARLDTYQLLSNQLAIDVQMLVAGVANGVARQAHYTLDVVDRRIAWVAKHHHIPALWITHFDDFLVDHRQADPVRKFVHQNEVAHIQCRLHRARRNLERLNQKRTQHQHDEQHREERLAVLDQQRFLVELLDDLHISRLNSGLIVGNGLAPARSQEDQIEQRQQTADGDSNNQQQREI